MSTTITKSYEDEIRQHFRDNVVQDVDGFHLFWPDRERGCGYSAHHLRVLVEYMDELDAPAQKAHDALFSKAIADQLDDVVNGLLLNRGTAHA